MRRAFLSPLLAVAVFATAAPGSALAQSVSTDPVGFLTVSVAAGSPTNPTYSLISPALLRAVEWQGPATVSGTTMTVTGTPWSASQFGTNGQYFVEIVSGTTPGAWTDIQASGVSTLTTLDDLTAFAGANATIRIRKHTMLTDFLGATNSAGLKGGTSLYDADEITVYDGGTSATYWYYDATDNNGVGAGWVDSKFQPAANVTIAPNQGVVIKRKGATALTITSTGCVKTGNTLLPVSTGLNVLGTIAAKGLTLGTSGLYTGVASTGVAGGKELKAADEIMMFTQSGSAVYWYYDASDNNGVGAGWYDSAFKAADSTAIPAGVALVLTRKAPSGAFNWTVPSPSSF